MSEATEYPHIYKKNQLFKFKPLSKNNNGRKFYFSSIKGSIPNIISHCNNLNEIVGRCLLGIWKLNSFFGISRDPTDKPNLSKGQSVYNNARLIFKQGGDTGKEFQTVKELLKNLLQDQKILEKKIEELSSKIEPEPLTKEKLESLEGILNRLDGNIKTVLGIE